MRAQKAEWRKPELVVLVRTRPEEAVLGACKNAGVVGGRDGSNCMWTKQNGSVSQCANLNKS